MPTHAPELGAHDELELFSLPHGEARRRLEGGGIAYLAVDPVEYHGPHLSLRNDGLLSRALSRALHGALRRTSKHDIGPLLWAGELAVGVDPTPGPGSRAVPFRDVRRLVLDACAALADMGAQRVVLMTFHGAPLHDLALEAGVRALTARGVRALCPFFDAMRALCTLDGHKYPAAFAAIREAAERTRVMESLRFDFHAGYVETSLALRFVPESVAPSHRDVPPCPPFRPVAALEAASKAARALGRTALAEELALAAVGTAWHTLRPFPGYTGSPHLANVEAGEVFGDLIVDAYAAAARSVLEDGAAAPRAIMPWLERITLGGRLTMGPTPA